ncbi:unnamed protein product [Peniophora sp. CBMAI 1063]|nr:unnamed protein product [Peniophora sp. CBMAI 1063]
MPHLPHLASLRDHIKHLGKHRHPEEEEGSFHLPSPIPSPTTEHPEITFTEKDKADIAGLIAEYGSSSNTSWLEFSRYKIWRADKDIEGSSFRPVQGYLRSDPYVFAWGNPLVSDPAALDETCYQFWKWCKNRKLKLIWCCADGEMEKVLGKNSRFGWSTVSCIVEDMLDPKAVVELAKSTGSGAEVKDFKKNIRRAERAGITVREIKWDAWTDTQKKEVEEGVAAWKKHKKSANSMQIASTSFQPWVDAEHRRYWVSEHQGKIVGLVVLSRIHHDQYQIKNHAAFPNAPHGTSEYLIYQAMDALNSESDEPGTNGTLFWEQNSSGHGHDGTAPSEASSAVISPSASQSGHTSSNQAERPDKTYAEEDATSDQLRRVSVTFGITASEELIPVDNLKGWRVSFLTKTYNTIISHTGITRRGDYRSKFHTVHLPMYVCFPRKQGFGVEGATKLIKCLRQ